MYMAKTRMLFQLHNYCAADMYHYFVHMQKGRFSLDSAHLYGINEQSQ